jgi:hypothetical protein
MTGGKCQWDTSLLINWIVTGCKNKIGLGIHLKGMSLIPLRDLMRKVI